MKRTAVLVILVGVSACVGPTPEFMLQSVEEDRRLGGEVKKQAEQSIGLYEDPARTAYVQALSEGLLAQVPDRRFEYEFAILDQTEPNAFAAPGGYVFVSRGLLAIANTEDELANAVAHEIQHVEKRHTARQLAKARVPGLLALPGAVVGQVVSRDLGRLLNAPVNTVGLAVISAHSRQDELEADRRGQQLCAAAGYDPAALAPLLERMEEEHRLRAGKGRKASFFDTHPTTPDRSRKLVSEAGKLERRPGAPIAATPDAFLEKLDGMLVGTNPAHGIFRDQAFLQPDLDFFIEFPAQWQTINSPMFVGALAPEKDGLVFMGIAGPGDDPQAVGQEFEKQLREEHKIEPSESKAVEIGDWPGYVVTVTDRSAKEPMNIHILWVSNRGLMYQLIGLAPEHHRATLRDTAFSLRELTVEERASIREQRLRIVEARAGEDFEALGHRTGNAWDAQTTATLNGLPIDQPLAGGQHLKIAVWRDYTGRR